MVVNVLKLILTALVTIYNHSPHQSSKPVKKLDQIDLTNSLFTNIDYFVYCSQINYEIIWYRQNAILRTGSFQFNLKTRQLYNIKNTFGMRICKINEPELQNCRTRNKI